MIVLELWKQTTSVSKFRLKRLGRAMGYWKFVVDNDEEKQRLIMEERLEKHERQLQRSQVLGAIAMTATVSSLCLALLCFLKDRAWKKSFRERQLQIEDELQNKEREYKIDLDKVEQRVKKSNLARKKETPLQKGIHAIRRLYADPRFGRACVVLRLAVLLASVF